MAKLYATLNTKSLAEQATFVAQLRLLGKASAIGHQARINLEAESRVAEAVWTELIDAVLTAESKPSGIRIAIREVLRRHLLDGPTARCTPSTVFGRAVPLKRLAKAFVADGSFGSPAAAHSHVRAMCGKPLDYLQRLWKSFALGRFVMWATFDVNGRSPFYNLSSCAEIMGILGLSKEERLETLVLLEYLLPATISPRIPRVVEAYASDDWIYYFRPAPEPDDDHGWTLPWPEFSTSQPRPEIVHEPIRGDCLVAPLSEVR